MFKKRRKFISILLSFALIITSLSLVGTNAQAAVMSGNEVTSGTYGDGVTYTYYKKDDNVEDAKSYLLFEGTGALKSLTSAVWTAEPSVEQSEEQPWIQAVTGETSVESYGAESGVNDSNYTLDEIIFDSSISDIGNYTFANYKPYTRGDCNFRIGENITVLPEGAFAAVGSVKIYIYGQRNIGVTSEDLTEDGVWSFDGSSGVKFYVATDDEKTTLSSLLVANGLKTTKFSITVDETLAVDSTTLQLAIAKADIQQRLHGTGESYDNYYSGELWTTMLSALSEGETALETYNSEGLTEYTDDTIAAKETELNTYATAIENALQALEDSLNVYNSLSDLAATAAAAYTTEADYTSSSWSAYKTALETAQTLLSKYTADEYSETECEEAEESLTEAIAGLVSVTALTAAMENAESALELKNYCTKTNYDTFYAVYEEAVAMIDAGTATQDSINTMAESLTNATETIEAAALDLSALETIATKTTNQYFVFYNNYQYDEDTYTTNYTKESLEAYCEVYKVALSIVDTGIYNQEEITDQDGVDAVYDAVVDAYNALTYNDNTAAMTALQDYYDEVIAAGYEESSYTAASWATYTTALETALARLESTSTVLITSLQKALTGLQEAVEGLEEKSTDMTVTGDAYLEYEGTWQKQCSSTNAMDGYVAEGSEASITITNDWWLQIDNLDLSGMQEPTLLVEYEANDDKLQIYGDKSGSNWDYTITENTDSSGYGEYAIDSAITKLYLTSYGNTLVYTHIKIYDSAEESGLDEAKETLQKVIAEVEGLTESDYTEESWKVLQDALEAAQSLSDDATAEEIENAATVLKNAIASLEASGGGSGTDDTGNTSTPSPSPTASSSESGKTFTSGKLKYKVVNASSVTVKAPKKKSVKSVTIPATVKNNGTTYKVTAIANNAFKNCKKLKKITIGKNITTIGKNAFKNDAKLKNITVKATSLKKVGKSALKGINKKAVIKVPKKKQKKYKKLFKNKGQKKTVKIK